MVQTELLDKIEDERLSVHVVWTPVLQKDEYRAAFTARELITDSRSTHYWDGDMYLGTAFGKSIELPNGRDFAWDIYFAFPDGVRWQETVPTPSDFSHQLGRDERHLGDGSRLREIVEGLLQELE